ncbi:hypothetical protein LTR56_027494 [Elasticomyces elasticus]|nr:hypothetical protein LTR56_027494 [Elasticomyces elasticus]KAK5732002.1 hypothetical protein LTS12_027186 [Elasticomyces elasticus]
MAPQIHDPLATTPNTDANYLAENNAANILALVGSLGFVAVVVVAMRLYVRVRILKSTGMDDYLIAASMVLGIGMFVCFVGETYNGLGRHYSTTTFGEQEIYLKWIFAHSVCTTTALSLVKVSIACFLMRLAPRRSWQWFLWATIVIGVVTDFLFATIPIPIVMQLHLDLRSRVVLAVVMSLGYIACGAAVAKSIFLWNYPKDKDRTFHDWFFVLAAIELYLGILSASLPSLKRLATRFFERARTMLSSSRQSKVHNPAEQRNSRDGYQRQENMTQHMELKAMDSTVVSATVLSKTEDDQRASNSTAGIQRPYSTQITVKAVDNPRTPTPDNVPITVQESNWYDEDSVLTSTMWEAGRAGVQVPLSDLWLEKDQR